MKKCIVLANGTPPKKSVIKYLNDKDYKTLYCADGGANTAFKLNIVPDYIIGDLDSITDNVKEYYSDKSKIIKYTRQDDTDVEKCLKHAIGKGFTEAVLIGGTGDRLDHSFCNLGIVLKFFDEIKIKVLHQASVLEAMTGKINLKTVAGETISLYGFDRKTKITSTGLKYSLDSTALPFGERESTSNYATGNSVNLKITGGKIFVVRLFEILRKHDLF
ncbi:MAG: thiamine diphosphokinase [Ignavibacteriae bacterium]|nr:thiamine diphosphokinase [Ignavibacteriota bacterium]NOG98299.1 thiamine diphosphokinase [Ignavibacteriota bacterium]